MPIKMFISHSTKDEDFVKEIELLLSRKFRDRIEPIISSQLKIPYENIGNKIIQHITESEFFMVLLTKNSKQNPTVIFELGYSSALFHKKIIHQIIPIVERIQLKKGRTRQIHSGIFVHPSLESAKYFSDKLKWGECLLDIEEYLKRALDLENRPRTDYLEARAQSLEGIGLFWEAAESLKEAGKKHKQYENFTKAIEDLDRASKIYKEAEYLWEAAQMQLAVAKLFEKDEDLRNSALSYEKRGKLLVENPEYGWESANSFEKAGDLFSKNNSLKKARSQYQEALKIYVENENETEASRVKRKLEKLR